MTRPLPRRCDFRLAPIALALLALLATRAAFAGSDDEAPPLQLSPSLAATPRGEAARALPIVLRAREIRSRPDLDAQARGEVEFRRAGTVISADRLDYSHPDDTAHAVGNVRIEREGAVFRGPELRLQVNRFEGYFLEPEFDFPRHGAGGRAKRFDFIDENRGRATDARYTSCPRDGSGDPDWMLTTRRLHLDTENNEGVAEGGRLVFLGVPILAIPRLSFAITDERKSGWLPPTLNIDNRSGIELSVPYYWNIAPNRDATITPKLATRRGAGVEGEFRYLAPADQGEIVLDLLPDDRLAGRNRWLTRFKHEGTVERSRYALDGVRVSDDDWWKDFRRTTGLVTQRLLPLAAQVERPLQWAGVEATAYARVKRWQVLQSADAPIASPYDRSLQLGLRHAGTRGGFEWQAETELNRFTLADGQASADRPTGLRAHLLGSLTHPWRTPAGWLLPRLVLNAAAYDLDQPLANDGRRHLARVIPSASVDAGLVFERNTPAFGRDDLKQTLEPRLLYVRTAYRAQNPLLAFDSAPKDFSFSSIFSDNAFTGIDRVSDANQLTAGVTTRLVEPASGAELLRLGLVQRYQFSTQRNSPVDEPQRRFSDVLLLGSTSVVPNWLLDASVQFNADVKRSVRSILSARYSPGPFRTVGATYRLARDSRDPLRGIQSEQVEMGWQWPVYGPEPGAPGAAAAGAARCQGRLFSVGRVNYSMTDSRITDSIVGFEYDAGCWIARAVAERLSTGRSEATTRLMLQLELVGLSRLGTNPLKTLKDNIPGYRLLRDDRDERDPP